MQLMSLGLAGYGGASVPNYRVGTTVGTVFAITTGGGLEVALVVGIPAATLGVQLDVLAKMVGTYFTHEAAKAADKGKYKKKKRFGKSISNIETIITDNDNVFAHELKKSIILSYLYIIPLFDIFIIRVIPIISITEIEDNIANNILNMSPIWSNNPTIFLSATTSHVPANNL